MASDLHCHTKISDGSIGIEDLIGIAKRRGLTAVSVTDHDTTAGATRAVIVGKRMGVQVIHGVELSTTDTVRGREAHLLCYLCDHPDRLEGLCRRIGAARRAASTEMIRRVMRYYPLSPDLVIKCATGSTNIFPQHIMHALMDAGYANAIFGDLYTRLFAVPDGSAYVETIFPDTREVLSAIHEAGGIAVLAHPYLYHSEELLEDLIPLGLDGVEVFHPSHTPKQTEALQQLAQERRLLMTGGSDFHGMYASSARPVGAVTAPDECITALLDYKSGRHQVTTAVKG